MIENYTSYDLISYKSLNNSTIEEVSKEVLQIDKILYENELLGYYEKSNSDNFTNGNISKKIIIEEVKCLKVDRKVNVDLDEKITNEFLNLVKRDDFESGYESTSEHFVLELFKKNKEATKMWLQSILLKSFGNPKVLVGILHIISHIEYKEINPEGQVMALACLSNENLEVQDYAIKAFENWGNKESVNYLRSVKCLEDWLQNYLEEVILDLEEGD